MSTQTDTWVVDGQSLTSRLILGTGKYTSHSVMRAAHESAEVEIVTVAVRRVDLSAKGEASLLHFVNRDRIRLLPNTAGCYTVEDALRTARLGQEAGLSNWVKLEVLGDERTLLPDPVQTLEAARILVKEGFIVFVYTTDDPILALRLEDAGVHVVMPAGSPIGSGLGVLNPHYMRIMRERLTVPMIVDAGVGTASDVAIAMELGVDGVLLNTAVAEAQNPPLMAAAMRDACRAGRMAWLAGRMPRRAYASASSPIDGHFATGPRGGTSGTP
ncbi:MAG TPA: thiazole synthase [Planctomycetota bacterium]|nr:thiazole synthase [Planctomycetota bacterium]